MLGVSLTAADLEWLLAANSDDHPEVAFWIGYCHLAGTGGVEENLEQAVWYFQKAANHNHAKALWWLAQWYHEGFGAPENETPETQKKLFQQAIVALQSELQEDANDAEAQFLSGFSHALKEDLTEKDREDITEEDAARLFSLFQQAAQQGHVNGQHFVASLFQDDDDCVQAAGWFAQAARQGFSLARQEFDNLFEEEAEVKEQLVMSVARDGARDQQETFLAASALAYYWTRFNGATSTTARKWQEIANNCTNQVPPSWKPRILVERKPLGKSPYPREWKPFDVFLVHTGAQKREIVAPLKDHLEQQGFRCFFEMEMKPSDGSPTDYMRFGLETCRHAVVVLSQEFLDKGANAAPCQELSFAFQRMDWLRTANPNHSWQSLWIVFFYITVDDYNREAQRNPFPKLSGKVVLREYPGVRYDTWTTLYKELTEDLKQHDVERKAVAKWKDFLARRWRVEGHPTADKLYGTATPAVDYSSTELGQTFCKKCGIEGPLGGHGAVWRC